MATLPFDEPAAAGRPASGRGIVLHAPRHYDLQVWLATRGRERELREAMLDAARLRAGERMLDVGCGPGTLAIAAARRLGPEGAVCGVDASPEMVAAARSRARKAGVHLEAEVAEGQALPFADDRFDVVTATLMLHHLPHAGRLACVAEMARVTRPGGRVLLVDFATSSQPSEGLLGRLHRHGRVRPEALIGLAAEAGLRVAASEPLGRLDLHWVLATKAERPA